MAITDAMELDFVHTRMTSSEWDPILNSFDDASFYQTWAYGAVRWGSDSLEHLVISLESELLAAAQVSIRKAPLGLGGIAYVPFGPMCRRRKQPLDPVILIQAVEALQTRYARQRGLLLRLQPNLWRPEDRAAMDRLRGTTRRHPAKRLPYRTLMLDLSRSLEEIRASLVSNWRSDLRRAERVGFEVICGTEMWMMHAVRGLHKAVVERKGYVEYVDPEEMLQVQEQLSPGGRMQVFLVKKGEEILAGMCVAMQGDTGLPILTGSTAEGLKLRANYILFWRILEYLKEAGYRWLDLGGINPKYNPSVYRFKSRMLGKQLANGREAQFVGHFDYCDHSVFQMGVYLADYVRYSKRNLSRWWTARPLTPKGARST